LPPTMRVSGLATSVETPHSMFLAADSVSRPGPATIGGSGSVGIEFSRISVELIDCVCGLCVDVVVDNCVVVGRSELAVVCSSVVAVSGFTGFA